MYNKLFAKYGHKCEIESNLKELKVFQTTTNPITRYTYAWRRVNEESWEGNQFLRSQMVTDDEHYKHVKHMMLVHPFSKLRKGWEMFMAIVFFWQFITIPIELASLQGKGTLKLHTWVVFGLIRFILDIFCVFDIIMNFLTGYLDNKKREVIMDPLRIARRYVQTYFIIDLASSIPESVISHYLGRYDNDDPLAAYSEFNILELIVLHISMFKILRLLTFLKYCRHFLNMAANFPKFTVFLRLTACLLVYLILVHYVVCVNISVSYYTEPENITKKEGVVYFHDKSPFTFIPRPHNGTRSKRQMILGDPSNFSFFEYYLRYFYQTVIMLTRTGTGFRKVRSLYTQLYVTIIWFLSMILYFVVIAYVMGIVSSFNAAKHKYIEMVEQLREYMRYKQLPEHLQRRLIKNYEYRFQKTYFRESAIMRSISGHLRQEIVMHSCRKLVEGVVFFKNLPTRLLVHIVTCMKVEIFLQNDVIARANTVGNAMYFIATGTVAIYTTKGLEIVHLDDGHHFGEIAMVKTNHVRVASVIAIEMSEMYRLDQEDFARAILPFPEVLSKIEQIASARMEQTTGLNYGTYTFNKPYKKKDIAKLRKSLFYLL